MTVQIHDSITIQSQRRKTPEGFLVAPAVIGRAGILEYNPTDPAVVSAPAELRSQNRTIRMLRPDSAVFDSNSMGSFAGKPVLNEHSIGQITPDNYKEHIKGVTGTVISRENDTLKADLTIYDSALISEIEGGKAELSQGYTAIADWKGGSDPKYGDYDGTFSNITGNHIAVTVRGRSGPGVRILDSDKNNDGKGVKMAKRLINGVEVEIPDNVVGVVDSYLSNADKATKDLAELTGKVAAMEKQIAEQKAEIARVTDSAYVDGRVKERAAVIDAAKKIMPAIVTDSKSDDAIRAEVIKAAGLELTDPAAIRGAFAALAVQAPAQGDSARVADSLRGPDGAPAKSAETLYNEARAKFAAGQK